MSYIFVFLLLSVGSIFFSFYNKKYEESLPLTIGIIIIYLYIAYIFNILHIAFYILLSIIGFIYAYCIYRFIKEKEKKKVLKNIFTPGFIIFLLSYIVIFYIVRGREVLLWDELRLWGAYPKLLFYDGSIQLGKAAKLFQEMQSYEPGMPLFQFFFTKSSFRFIEGDLFLAYAIVGIAPLIATMKNFTFKHWYYIPILVVIGVCLPLVLANSSFDSMTYYYTLYIEPILGMYFAYTLYLSTKVKDDNFNYALFIISLCTLVLFKDTGIIFALTSIFSYLLINRKNKDQKLFKKIIPILLCLLLLGSWKGVQKIYESQNLYSSTIRSQEIITFFTGMNKEQKNILNEFGETTLEKSYDSNFDKLEKFINIYTVFISIIIGMSFIIIKSNKNDKRKYKATLTSYIIGSLIFIIGTLLLYIFSIHRVASFQRYSSIVLNSGIIFIVLFILEKLPNLEKKWYPLVLYTSIFIILVTPIKGPYIQVTYLYEASGTSKVYSNKIAENIKPKESLLMIFGEATKKNLDGVIYHHHAYMNLIDEGFGWIPNTILLENEYTQTDSVLIDKDLTLDKIKEKYDYIYFIVVKDEDKDQFSRLLETNIEESTLFKVKKDKTLEAIN